MLDLHHNRRLKWPGVEFMALVRLSTIILLGSAVIYGSGALIDYNVETITSRAVLAGIGLLVDYGIPGGVPELLQGERLMTFRSLQGSSLKTNPGLLKNR